MKRKVGVVGVGVIVLALVLILPTEGISFEKKGKLALETAQLNLSLERKWPVLKLNSVSSLSDTYRMVGLEKIDPQKQPLLKVEDPVKQTWIGPDTVFIGRLTRDEDGNLDSILGMSAGVGIAYRYYFKKPEELRALHLYWELGTMILLWPYGTLGATYPIPLGGEEEKIGSLFCIDLYVGVLIPFPFAGIGLAATF